MLFCDKLQKAGINPDQYLALARNQAVKNAYDPERLYFSNDITHKLQYITPLGRIIRFGSAMPTKHGVNKHFHNDFIIYSMLEHAGALHNGYANEMRHNYHARAAPLANGESKYSPAKLALKILW
jgi:hypothetical protein